ncbi:amino acid adenylation domain-containing protein [Kitasatospora sp. NPDC056531]|uniref:non-ribosomal peptide synthetase n=1 Tax=Kitasatospora sp. NPDC056531 TaxID=3345856 RepID=UPI00368C7305
MTENDHGTRELADGGFPLTEIQAAYMVGKSRLIELGGRQQYYLELDSVGLDPQRAEEAMNRLILRHDHLRTVMGEDGFQRTVPADRTPRVRITVDDLTGLDRQIQEEALRRTRDRMCDEGLDPAGWPLFEVTVSRTRRHRARLHLRASLLLLDAPSIRTVVGEWWELYRDPAAQLPPVTTTFRDWREALLAHENSPAYEKQWTYWEERLDSLPEAPQLPLARQPQSIGEVRFTGRTSYLTGEEWQRFCENFRKHRVLPTTALIHVYAETLGAWTASPNFCLNVVHLNQAASHSGQEVVVGQRTATLPLEVDLTAGGGFWERAQRLQRRLWSDMANSDVTAVRISRELAARRGWTQRATLPYVFTSNQGPGWESMAAYDRPRFRFLERVQHTPQVLLDDQVRDMPDGGIGSNLDFVDLAFPPGLPELMVEAYDGMLKRLAAADGAEVEPDPVPARHRALIDAVNDTAAPEPEGRLEDGFLRQAAERAAEPAVVTSGRTLSYQELEQRSRAVARWLIARGVGRETVVPVVMSKGWEQIVAVLGVLRSGAAYCPIDAATPALPMREMLVECAGPVMLTQSHARPRHEGLPELTTLEVDGVEPDTEPLPPVAADPDDLAYVIYTSGSTGKAKGVMIEHRAALNTVLDLNRRIGLDPADRVFGISSMSFDLSVWDVFGTLAAGARLVVPDATSRPDPFAWMAAAAEHGVTVWNSVPALTEMITEIAEQRPEIGRPPIRAFLLSGDWIPTTLPERMRVLWNGVRIMAMGGATEAAVWSNLFEVGEVDPEWPSIPYGRPLTNQTMRVLDHRLGIRQPWAVGRIYIGGVGLARGYRNDPERTAERFVRHPETGERLYWTGDLGRYWPDGTIEFLGREDRQVKILGFRVEPGAVETATRSHPAVRECVVCVDDAPGGQRRLLLLVVPEPGERPDGREIAAHLRTLLPHYMVPAHIQIVDRLPLTPNGKVDVRRARALVSAGEGPAVEGADAGPLARRLAGIWEELLEVPAVDVDDNFFALGGNSLLALRMVNRIRAEEGADLPLGQLFEAPTVRQLAAAIAEGAGAAGSCHVELADGEGEELFLFHVLGGSVAPYLSMAAVWPGPVRGFQSRGLVEVAPELPADLETLAKEYREEIQRYRPEGPYVLGGWSMGGFLAYEVARQLGEQGQKAYVLMIDTDIPDIELPDTEVGRHIAFMVNLNLGPAPQAAIEAIGNAAPDRIAEAGRDTAVAHGLLPAEVDVTGYLRLMRIHENDLRLVSGWQPAPLDQPAFLLVGDEELDRPDPVAYWRKVCPGLEVETAPGDHFTIGTGDRLGDIAVRGAKWLEGRMRAEG